MKAKFFNFLALVSLAYFSYLLLLISLQYIPFSSDVAFLRIKMDQVQLPYYIVSFKAHVFTSFFLLIAGFTQFNKWIRTRYRQLHRWMGWSYITILLLFSAPSGLVLGWHANGGWISQLAFVILGVLWIYFTIQALRFAIKKDWTKHCNFMIRSYALTLSAISLRLFKYIIVFIWHPLPMDTYRIVAWLGWVVNLIIAEIIIHKKARVV
ncbi:MAG: hypothetical protein ACJAR8_001526 [Bacteroidia bacterium]